MLWFALFLCLFVLCVVFFEMCSVDLFVWNFLCFVCLMILFFSSEDPLLAYEKAPCDESSVVEMDCDSG